MFVLSKEKKMRFKIFKASLDGIAGGDVIYSNIESVLKQISYYEGWKSLKDLHNTIADWASKCDLGDSFCTQATAIIAVGIFSPQIDNEDICPVCEYDQLNYYEFEPVEDGHIEQELDCPNCGWSWKDIFVFAERRKQYNKKSPDIK